MSKTIVLDPGHDYRNTWNKGPTGYLEHEGVYGISTKIKYQLERHGCKVILTRDANSIYNDQDGGLAKRAQVALDANADVFISIHSNAAGNTATNGAQVFYHGTAVKGKNLSELIYGSMTAECNNKGNVTGVQSDFVLYRTGFGVLRPVAYTIPSALVEVDFHTNPEAEALLKTEDFRKKAAKGIAKGILAFLGITWVSEVKQATLYLVKLDNIQKGAFSIPQNAVQLASDLIPSLTSGQSVVITKVIREEIIG